MAKSVVKKESVATPAQVKKLLRADKEKQVQIMKEQERLLKLHRSRSRLSREDHARARGIELERHHQITGNKDGLAEALAMQGRFREAYSTALRKDLKKEYKLKMEAVEADDDKDCFCDNFIETENKLMVPNKHLLCRAYSEKHGRVMSFIKCAECGFVNATALPQELAELQDIRRKAEAGAETSPEQAFQSTAPPPKPSWSK